MVSTQTEQNFDAASYLNAGLSLLDITIDAAWASSIVANLKVLLAAAALVGSFDLPDEIDAASVFEA